MLNSIGFDQWAGEYDESIPKLSAGYPFEGYYDVLSFVNRSVDSSQGKNILDIGVGTGLLTKELYHKGAEIYGIDFSTKMLEIAKRVMPKGRFFCHDFQKGLPAELKTVKFDYIISSYAIHHLNDDQKVDFISELKGHLIEGGKIIVADIAFGTKDEMRLYSEKFQEDWDNDEVYMTEDEMLERLRKRGIDSIYTQISLCAGVLEIV